jgi:hypothetical protein
MNRGMQRVAGGLFLAIVTGAWSGTAWAQMDGSAPAAAKPGELPAGLAAKEEPVGGHTLAEVRSGKKVGDEVVVRVRVSSERDAFAKGRGEFTVVDRAEPAAGAVRETAVVRVVDAAGGVIKTELRNRGGLTAGSAVTIAGTLLESEIGKPLVIRATKLFVAPLDLPEGFFLSAVPEGSKTVEEVKPAAKKGDTVAVRGRIGGSEHPFVDGRAVFTIVGPGLKACSDHEDDHCKIPWDYCCETKTDIVLHSATIQVLDASGKPLKLGMKGRGGLKELSDVSVVGKVTSADEKTLVVQALGMYIHPAAK